MKPDHRSRLEDPYRAGLIISPGTFQVSSPRRERYPERDGVSYNEYI